MEISKHHLKMIEAVAQATPRVLRKYYREDCCIVATRIVMEVLKKLHFKNLKPLTIEANIFNEAYVRKGRAPQSEEEAQEYLKEGAWQVVLGDRSKKVPGKWDGHLVLMINDNYMLDVAVYQACRPHKQIQLEPVFTSVPDGFTVGEDRCQLMFNNCLIIYQAFPDDKSYQTSGDWQRPERSKRAVQEVYEEVKEILA